MSRVRLVDDAWPKSLPDIAHIQGYQGELITELRDALALVYVQPSQVGSSELERAVTQLFDGHHIWDARFGEHGRWCQYGFRHRIYHLGHCYCATDIWHDCGHHLESVTGMATRILKIQVGGDAVQTSYCREWSVGSALGHLSGYLDEVARQLDRVLHDAIPPMRDPENPVGTCDAYDQDFIWHEPSYAEQQIIDTITDVALEKSLKTLWVLSKQVDGTSAKCNCKPKGCKVRKMSHNYRKVYNELERYHTEIIDVSCQMPFMFDALKTRAEIEESIRFTFTMMQPTDAEWSAMEPYGVKRSSNQTTQWKNTRYAVVSNERPAHGVYTRQKMWDDGVWGGDPASLTWIEGRKEHLAIPTHKLRIALATWCVAKRVWRELQNSPDT